MKEVILNDECMHCNDRECHDGEHFCNEAMKDNSFYKNARLYKGLEVIQRPTYKDLEKENTELKARLNAINLLTPELQKASNLRKQQLIKAKICLEQLVSEITVGELEVDPNILQQAEQFLSEVEK